MFPSHEPEPPALISSTETEPELLTTELTQDPRLQSPHSGATSEPQTQVPNLGADPEPQTDPEVTPSPDTKVDPDP